MNGETVATSGRAPGGWDRNPIRSERPQKTRCRRDVSPKYR